MPWTCANPDCATVVARDDVMKCPVCGVPKKAWTLHAQETRRLVVRSKRIDCRRGAVIATAEGAPVHLGVSWHATKEASVLSRAQAVSIRERRLLPDARDLLSVRMSPGSQKQWTLTIAIEYETRPIEELTFEFEPDAEAVGKDERFVARFLFIHGEAPAVAPSFPSIDVLDVTEETALGHAPQLTVRGFRSSARVRLVKTEQGRLECRTGRTIWTGPASSAVHAGVAWHADRATSVLTKAEAKRLREGRLLPDSADLLCVRMFPAGRPRWDLKLTTEFATKPPETLTLEFQPEAALGADDHLAAHFLCVRGPEPLEGLELPFVQVLDVTEEGAPGHAPRLRVEGLGEPVVIELGARAAEGELECRTGRTIWTGAGSRAVHAGVSWHAASSASVLTKAEARRLREGRLLPDTADLLCVRMFPAGRPRWDLKLTTEFAGKPHETLALEFQPESPLEADERVAAHFLCVRGPEPLEGLELPFVQVLDVTDEGAPGHAPRLRIEGLGEPRTIELRAAEGPPEGPRVECRRGQVVAGPPDGPAPVSWLETRAISVLPRETARALRAAGQLPHPQDLLAVRVFPGSGAADARCRLRLEAPPRILVDAEFEAPPESLDARGSFTAYFLLVHGPGAALTFPFIEVVDVSEGAGHAPAISVAAGGPAVSVHLEPGTPTPRPIA